MKPSADRRFPRKHQAIVATAREVFMSKGYEGTSMEEIAVKAGVSKQTVYKHFADKERLFSEIVLDTTGEVDRVVGLVTSTLAATQDLPRDLERLGRRLIAALMDPQLLRLRRLVIANAERMPELGRTWYQGGFERVLTTLASSFKRLSEEGLLHASDPLLAAHHFVGLLLWIPVNQSMFTGDERPLSHAALERYADAGVQAFLAAYAAKSSDRRLPRARADGAR